MLTKLGFYTAIKVDFILFKFLYDGKDGLILLPIIIIPMYSLNQNRVEIHGVYMIQLQYISVVNMDKKFKNHL